MTSVMMTAKWLLGLERKEPPDAREEFADAGVKGLYLVRQPSGAMSWAARYRHAGKPRKLTLGPYPLLGLAEARQKATEALRAASEGSDPAGEKAAQRAAVRAGEPVVDRDQFATVVGEFLKREIRPKNRSHDLVEAIFKNHVTPKWGDRKIQSITRRDVIEVTDGLVDKGQPYAANRTFAHVRRLFNWAISRGIVNASPCAGMKLPGAEQARDRVLSDAEIRLFWLASEELEEPFRGFFRVLLLTGQRRDEVAGMRASEVDGAAWMVPGDRTKNARANLVPISSETQAVLDVVPRIAGSAGYLFTTTGRTPISGFSRVKARLDALMLARARKETADDDAEEVKLPEWRIHDLRRTAATGMARLRVAPHVIEAVLNHKSGRISGIASVYNRFEYEEEKRSALAAWGRFVLALTKEGETSNVVELRASP
ncbi:tyrosine-type recombinase/integrase [Pleomorphomonas carboxyditropha]|uniref:Tyr recombinase domain-containing protein n=1 Tax=Pleomorphomonas carboxyditropha TaxID=2023338 RepID=A0A2G9WPE4_9HYPH|nr:site-specific integrase [Pleomorphomonas carboxyditropha]PIO96577.1 hypothetical protein CJ014_24755 [Pleomorphomonas carboxyditropha]